jgi:hypothetical protein
MRKFVFGSFVTGLLVAVAMLAMPVRESHAVPACDGPCPVTRQPASQSQGNMSPWWAICGISSAAAEIIGAAANGNNKNDPRQSTLFEAGWYAAVCPAMLPWALFVSATCPDNRATLAIARLAHRYGLTHPSADWTPFTNAYGQACRDGTLSPAFLAFLRANGLRVGNALRGPNP